MKIKTEKDLIRIELNRARERAVYIFNAVDSITTTELKSKLSDLINLLNVITY